jgi:LmbE family N-acetylglucosaminyl deacetylase
VLEYGVALRSSIAAVVRRLRPEIVITNNFRETWDGETLNQADHIAVGRATLDAVRDAGNRWIFADQLAGGSLEPWGGVRQVWAAGSPNARHGVDTTTSFELGVASLEAHQAYIDGLGWPDFDAREFLESVARPTGSRLGATFGTSFEVFRTS